MSINVYGVPLSIDAEEWARLWRILGQEQRVLDGLQVSVATGTRLVTVSAGHAAAAGALFESGANENVALDVNNSGKDRIDYIVAEIDWSGTISTAGDITFNKGVAGSPAQAPDLSADQVAGVLWQIPLARVTVPNNAGQLAAGAVERCAPGLRRSQAYHDDITGRNINSASPGAQTTTRTIDDPGYDYRIYLSGALDCGNSPSGHARLDLLLDDVVLTQGPTSPGNDHPAVPPARASGVISGKSTKVTSKVTPINMTQQLVVNSGDVNMLVLPA